MHRTLGTLVQLAALVAVSGLTACSGSKFGGNARTAPTQERQDVSPGEGDQNTQPSGSPSPNGSPERKVLDSDPLAGKPPTPQDLDPCSGNFLNGAILIIDLKSGWFAGDGGSFFSDRINPSCPNIPALNIHYFHVTKAIIETNRQRNLFFSAQQNGVPETSREALRCTVPFQSGPEGRLSGNASPENVCVVNALDQFTQVWILSGDAADDLDIDLRSSLFTSLTDRIVARKAQGPMGLFLGAGLSNITHSNAVAEKILGAAAFTRNSETSRGVFPSPDYSNLFEAAPLVATSGQNAVAGTFMGNFSVLAGLSDLYDYGNPNLLGQTAGVTSRLGIPGGNSLFDREPPRCFADILTLPTANIAARDRCNNAVIGYVDQPGFRVLAEGNMARFYGLQNPQAYIARIARFLALGSN